MQKLFFILFLLRRTSLVCGYMDEKCCKLGHSIVIKNYTFACEMSTNKRIQSNFRKSDFFNKNNSGSCIDVYSGNKTAIFSVDVSTRSISMRETLNVKYFQKCCPMRQTYNKIIHSCAASDNHNYSDSILKPDLFIKIGLPQCDIISDEFFPSSKYLESQNEGIISNTGRLIPTGKFCVDSTLQGDFVLRTCEENHQICERIRCIHKCCPDGQSYVNGSNCFDTFKYGVDLHSSNKIHDPDAPFVVIHGIQKPIYVMTEDRYNISIDKTGLFYVYIEDSHIQYPVLHKKYCIEHAKTRYLNGYKIFAASNKFEIKLKFTITKWAKVASCICLLIVVLVYVMVPKLRNLFGNILLSYSVATFLMFLLLALSQFFHESLKDTECKIIGQFMKPHISGYMTILAVIWSFTWMHLMCIDIWCSIRAPRSTVCPLQKNEIKTMSIYSLCGWGMPILWIVLIGLLSQIEGIPHAIRPYIGEMKCLMESYDTRKGNYAFILFIVVPMTIQQIINIVLFGSTIMHYLHIERLRNERMRKNRRVNKERLILIMKLTVIMGITFSFEIVSSVFDFSSTKATEYIEVVWDSINCLQGVFIFFVFICKKKVYNYICEEVPILKTRKISSVPSSTTQHISLQQFEEKQL